MNNSSRLFPYALLFHLMLKHDKSALQGVAAEKLRGTTIEIELKPFSENSRQIMLSEIEKLSAGWKRGSGKKLVEIQYKRTTDPQCIPNEGSIK